ncbi:acetylpolyamine aminohydrolase, putative [Trichomonas vaginalis G3]|uniref:Histone deacetylase n=1 Tax=Trichomonas vaginalis (strain ATCC PRA-98 / G3) TaxID=412133 RepID=A2ERJ2_TRIV3|nr:histone deacetylase class I, eukaryotic type family [Trichomonas vaginalis G3]EAY04719.1 acetylpolyamine aminohydrolase, putative [Trichomonas vaginalis G3]KAI5526817.1 histone deacetylase class I, eukaryotic type family [Trichomonas vaginalis G3]|eukprot:XP_001316942.1 acetylpolyamine aminohydrolase [Trichomonas vaginalis G3]
MSIPKNRIAYFYDEEIGNFYYEEGHPMKPVRVRMTHSLVLAYKLHNHLQVFRPHRATATEMMRFHSPDYIKFLQNATPENSITSIQEQKRYCIGSDCPVFENIFEYCQISAGGSICAAQRLNYNLADIAINWAGGLHHAAKEKPSGFCYIADCVLGIMELLKYHPRVMYIDIDIHHGDGVEEAFYDSDRVLTCSFHKYGNDFFPGTGHVFDIGVDLGKYYAVNVPLRDGMTDEAYQFIFRPIISRLIEWFVPSAIMLQCGADSLVGDRLGFFNLSTYGHGDCVSFVKSFGIPLLVVGGGGYTKTSVARCWAYETSILTGVDIPNEMPETDYYDFYRPSYELHLKPDGKKNCNSREYLENVMCHVIENIRHLPGAPSVQMQELPPRDMISAALRLPSDPDAAARNFTHQANNEDDENEE